MIFVLDASVIISSLLSKRGDTEILLKEIFENQKGGKDKIYVPQLFYFEAANGLRFSLNNEAQSRLVFQKICALPLEIFNLQNMQLNEIIQLSYRNKTTVYDSSYHYSAILLGGTFLTCDSDYYKKAKHIGNIKFIN
jgi:predicted nucleic acid-binding protein